MSRPSCGQGATQDRIAWVLTSCIVATAIGMPMVGFLTSRMGRAFGQEAPTGRTRRFDWLGFPMLSLAIGALQMMLDPGESLDWFASREVSIEAVLAALAFYLFVAHMFTAKHPFDRARDSLRTATSALAWSSSSSSA